MFSPALGELQASLERINDVDCGLDVRDFVLTDADTFAELAPDGFDATRDEALLVDDSGDELRVSLYLAPEIVERVDAGSRKLDHAWCAALEGVSHFVYLAWNAGWERPVSALELELQAEVDKYALWLLSQTDRSPDASARLREHLFERFEFHEGLDDEEHARYLRANALADGVSGWLERECLCARDTLDGNARVADADASLIAALRRFYRMTRGSKLASAAACAARTRDAVSAP